jgi:CBS domain containing-hemolysin-like protein
METMTKAMPDASDDPPQRWTLTRLARLIGRPPADLAREVESLADPAPQQMRLRLAEFEASTVRDVMVPRAEVAAIDVTATLGDTLARFGAEGHSRLPVIRSDLDDPVGFVHIKDVVAELLRVGVGEAALADRPLERLKRDILFVPESMPLADLLVRMQASRIHMALVVDEYGGTDGLVCLEDLVEQIVGDIEDEHDEDEPMLLRRGRGAWDADARAEIDDVERETGLPLALPDYEDEIDTLGGLVFALAGRLPQAGETVVHPSGVSFEVLDVDQRRLKRLRLRPPAPAKANGSAEAEPAPRAVAPPGDDG